MTSTKSDPIATRQTPPSPERIFNTLTAYQNEQSLRAAIEIELFTAIAAGATTVEALAARCKASERGIRILCDFLVVNDFLTKADNNYGLAPESALFLDEKSPAYLGTITGFLSSAYLKNAFNDMGEIVRRGTTLLDGEGSMDPDYPMWVDFARAMMPMMVPPAQEIAEIVGAAKGEKYRVLDVAAGHGIFGVTIAKFNPQAEVTAVDWKNVLAVAKENAQAFGVADRFHPLPGSAFEVDWGTGYDLVLFTNFFHHFDQPTCENLMKKAHDSLNENGRAVTLEFVPNDDRVSPPMQASFSLTMLATTPAGDAYTFAQYDQMFRNAGYARSELHDLTKSPERVIVSYK